MLLIEVTKHILNLHLLTNKNNSFVNVNPFLMIKTFLSFSSIYNKLVVTKVLLNVIKFFDFILVILSKLLLVVTACPCCIAVGRPVTKTVLATWLLLAAWLLSTAKTNLTYWNTDLTAMNGWSKTPNCIIKSVGFVTYRSSRKNTGSVPLGEHISTGEQTKNIPENSTPSQLHLF